MKRMIGFLAALALIAPSAAQAQRVVPAPNASFTLTQNGFGNVEQQIQAIANAWGRKVGFQEIFNHAEQFTRPLGGTPVPNTITGFRWEDNNENETDWRPQGITGSADADASGMAGPYKVLITSWYHRPDPSYARITLHNTTASNDGAPYRHVLLVEPRAGGNLVPAQTHAGGLAWVGNHLYVASTNGLRVFNLDDIIKVKPVRRGELPGSYNYILPQSGSYTAPANPGLLFSSVSLDRTGGGLALVTSEYRHDQGGGRIVRFPVNPNGLLGAQKASAGVWHARAITDIQGALMKNGRFAVMTSYSDRPSHLYGGAPGAVMKDNQWSWTGAEDLFLVGGNDRLYTVTEFPGTRRVIAVDASDAGV